MTERKYAPLHEVTMYQARCTNCGTVEDDYGDFSAWGDPGTPVDIVTDNGWFQRWENGATVELLCEDCQRCEVCDSEKCYKADDHLVCEDHEGHDFSAVNV